MTIEIKAVIDPFHGVTHRERATGAEDEAIRKRLAIQRERDEQHRQKLIELGLIPPPDEGCKD
jgi:hypothetical protein